MTRWFRSLRWPLRDPVIREARDDYRDAQAAIREALERRVAELEAENGRLRSSLAAALLSSGLMQHYYAGTARRRSPDTEITAVRPRPRRRT